MTAHNNGIKHTALWANRGHEPEPFPAPPKPRPPPPKSSRPRPTVTFSKHKKFFVVILFAGRKGSRVDRTRVRSYGANISIAA